MKKSKNCPKSYQGVGDETCWNCPIINSCPYKITQGNRVLVTADTGWAEEIPDWLRIQITKDRMKNPNDVSDAEVTAYLFTASLRAPMQSDFVYIYCYLTAKSMVKFGIKSKLLPMDLKKDYDRGLSNYQKTLLEELRSKIKSARDKHEKKEKNKK